MKHRSLKEVDKNMEAVFLSGDVGCSNTAGKIDEVRFKVNVNRCEKN